MVGREHLIPMAEFFSPYSHQFVRIATCVPPVAVAEPAKNAEQLLERSISVMWAAANLEVVTSSVTAVTSSTSTLIKQQ